MSIKFVESARKVSESNEECAKLLVQAEELVVRATRYIILGEAFCTLASHEVKVEQSSAQKN
jgi:hypothetical protein